MNEKTRNISLENLSTFAEELAAKYAKKAEIPSKTSDLTNDAKFQTEEQVAASINAKIASTYKPGGSVAFADLPELTEERLGFVYNVTDKFTTTADFIEGNGKRHPAGTNVVIVQVDEDYKYDVLAGFFDLSGYAETEKVAADIAAAKAAAIEQANAATDEKLTGYVKTSDIEAVTEEEIRALFAEA